MGGGNTSVLSGSSGKALKGTLLNVRFREFTRIEYPDLKFEPPRPPDGVYPLEAATLHVPKYRGDEPVTEQWIYVFSLRHSRKDPGEYVFLAGEFWADNNGKYQRVAWSRETRDEYSNKDERPKGGAKESALFHSEGDVYVCASRIPLPADRLKEYLKSPALVRRRCLKLSLNSAHSNVAPPTPGELRIDRGKKNVYELFLINHLQVLKGLREKYQSALDEYGRELADESKAEQRILAALTLSTGKSYLKAKGWNTEAHLTEIDLRKVRYEQWSLHKDLLVAQKTREWYAGRLAWGMKATEFTEMRSDWWSAGEEEKAAWIEIEGALVKDLYQSDAGRDYAEWSMGQKDNLFEQLVASNSETGQRAFKIARKGAQTVNAARDIFINYAVVQLGTAKKLREAYKFFLPKTFELFDIPPSEIGVTFIKEKKSIQRIVGNYSSVDAAWSRIYFEARYGNLKVIKVSEAVRKAMPQFVLLLNVVNLLVETRAIQSKKTGLQTYGQIAAIGAASSATMASLRELAGKGPRRFLIVAGVLEAVASGFSAYDAYEKGDDIRAIAYGITAAAALMIAVGLTTVVGLMGVILYVLGHALLAIFTSSPLEDWFKECKWGNNPKKNYPIREQLKDLLFHIGKPSNVRLELARKRDGQFRLTRTRGEAEYLCLVVEPSVFMVEQTQFKAQILIWEYASRFEVTLLMPDSDDILKFADDGTVQKISHYWPIDYFKEWALKQSAGFKYTLQPRFLSGDGFDSRGYSDVKSGMFLSS